MVKPLLRALSGQAQPRPPVWLIRQAAHAPAVLLSDREPLHRDYRRRAARGPCRGGGARPAAGAVFSAHGLPEKIIKAGAYQWRCDRTSAALAAAAGIPDLDWLSQLSSCRCIAPGGAVDEVNMVVARRRWRVASDDRRPLLMQPKASHAGPLSDAQSGFQSLDELRRTI
jgi:hypothetical protein